MPMSRLILLAAALTIAAASETDAAGISVAMDNVTLVSFKKPFATVFIGNSAVAELAVIDTKHVFVLGKSFGLTNLIALGPDKSVISNEAVTVSGRSAGVVTVNLGAEANSYACSRARCESRPLQGDAKGYFDNMQAEVGAHEDAAIKAAAVPGLQTEH